MVGDYYCGFVFIIVILCFCCIIKKVRLFMGVFGVGYDVNIFFFIKCFFYLGFLSLKKKKEEEM